MSENVDLYELVINRLKYISLSKSDIKGIRIYLGESVSDTPIKELKQLKGVYAGGCTGFLLFKDNTWLELADSWYGTTLEYFSPPVLD